jgi:hypothetical protein
MRWSVYHLRRWAFVDLLELIGRFAIIVALFGWILERDDRAKSRYYQAWQLINSARMGSGDGGRAQALADLSQDGHSLSGLDARQSVVRGMALPGADLSASRLDSIYWDEADLTGAQLTTAKLRHAQLIRSNLNHTDFEAIDAREAHFVDVSMCASSFMRANLRGANIWRANLENVSFWGADLRNVNFYGTRYESIGSVKFANVAGTDPGFHDWAVKRGAVSLEDSTAWAYLPNDAEPYVRLYEVEHARIRALMKRPVNPSCIRAHTTRPR